MDLFAAYVKYAKSKNLKIEDPLLSDLGHVITKITGPKVGEIFWPENGQHVIQRIPPTETKGRKQTSYVVVSILPIKQQHLVKPLPEKELEIKFQTGQQNAGGQHANKTASAVRMRHTPTGLSVFINGRDQHANRREALKILTARVNEKQRAEKEKAYSDFRKQYVGDGCRGDKIRTYNILEGRCADHRTGKKTGNVKAVLEKGQFDLLR
jgi:peptide chain release factor 1